MIRLVQSFRKGDVQMFHIIWKVNMGMYDRMLNSRAIATGAEAE